MAITQVGHHGISERFYKILLGTKRKDLPMILNMTYALWSVVRQSDLYEREALALQRVESLSFARLSHNVSFPATKTSLPAVV